MLPVLQTQINTYFLCSPNKHVPLQLMAANTFSQTVTRSKSPPFSTAVPHLSISPPGPPEQTELQWRRKRGLGYSQHGHEDMFLLPTRHCSSGNIFSNAAWEKMSGIANRLKGENRKIPDSSRVVFDSGSEKALTLTLFC